MGSISYLHLLLSLYFTHSSHLPPPSSHMYTSLSFDFFRDDYKDQKFLPSYKLVLNNGEDIVPIGGSSLLVMWAAPLTNCLYIRRKIFLPRIKPHIVP